MSNFHKYIQLIKHDLFQFKGLKRDHLKEMVLETYTKGRNTNVENLYSKINDTFSINITRLLNVRYEITSVPSEPEKICIATINVSS